MTRQDQCCQLLSKLLMALLRIVRSIIVNLCVFIINAVGEYVPFLGRQKGLHRLVILRAMLSGVICSWLGLPRQTGQW